MSNTAIATAPPTRVPTVPDAASVVSKAVVRAADQLGLTNADLARTIGVSPATASRLRTGATALAADSKPYELAVLLIRLFRGLYAMVGGEEPSLRGWMTAENLALRGVPRDLVQTTVGLVTAVDYVDAARARL